MKLHSFHELAQRIAHLSTRDGKGVTVTFGGNQAYTNGKRINLPALPSGTILTPSQFSIWLGYVLHEGPGHLTHTDINLYQQTVKSRNDPVFSSVLNILEDVRIENADIALYPGDRKHLDQTHHYVDSQIPAEVLHSPDPIAKFYKSAFKYRNYDCPVQSETSPEILQALTALPQCKSTQDCINLATIITQLLKEENQNHDNGSGKNQPDQSDSSNQSDPSTARQRSTENGSQPSNSSQPGNNGNLHNDNQRDANDSGNAQGKSLKDLISSASSWQDLTEIKNLIKQLVEETINDRDRTTFSPPNTEDAYFPPADLSLDRIFVPSHEDLSTYLYTHSQLNSQILALKKMFRVYLQSQKKKSWLRGLEDGEVLDKDRLPAAVTGQKSIFKSPKNRQLINTAVELMLDLSLSMDEDLVRSAAIILSEALSATPKIKLSICGFTTNRNLVERYHYGSVGRIEGMDILVFKNYSEPYINCKSRLGAIRTIGLTPLGDAYGKAVEHILPQPEPRKIIFLVTDGYPEFRKGNPYHSDYILMDRVHKKAQKLKIETLGLGIGQEKIAGYLKPYVDKCLRIEQISDLPQALLQILKEMVK